MSQYYTPHRKRNLYNPKSKKPFALSRSRLEFFVECPRCFYIDRRLGVDRPPGFPYTLNSAVDTLLKKEFDIHRANGEAHPLMKEYEIDAIPFDHEKLDEWRENFQGIRYHDKDSNLIITGAVDDVWVAPSGKLIIVDYKSTSTDKDWNLEDSKWRAYGRQMEIYQWLFRQNGFEVDDRGYFVYCNGQKDRKAFDAKIEFDIELIPHDGDDSWVPQLIQAAAFCLRDNRIPNASPNCDFCAFMEARREVEL
jgi:RecB family exonuclease